MALVLMADFEYLPTDPLPADVVAVASYVDGTGGNPQYQAMCAKYPDLIHVAITALGATSLPAGPFFGDAEPGNGTIVGWVNWAQSIIANGRRPTLYCGLNIWYPQLEAALGTTVDYIVANYVSEVPTSLPAGCIGWQYTDAGEYDLTLIESSWLGLDPPPSTEDDDVFTFTHKETGAVYVVAGGKSFVMGGSSQPDQAQRVNWIGTMSTTDVQWLLGQFPLASAPASTATPR